MSRISADTSIRQVMANGTAVAGAVTVAGNAGKITTEALTTAGLAAYTLTITNTNITAADIPWISFALGSSTAGTPVLGRVTPGAGTIVVVIQNVHATVALNGTLVISYMLVHAPQ